MQAVSDGGPVTVTDSQKGILQQKSDGSDAGQASNARASFRVAAAKVYMEVTTT